MPTVGDVPPTSAASSEPGPRPQVSLIVPCYNASETIGECLGAIGAQTRPADEVIVVDDASADDTAAIAAGHECTVIGQPRNRGPSAARNAGIAAASGDILFFVDADVALRPDAVERAIALFEDDPELDIVHGTYEPQPMRGRGTTERYLVGREAHWRHRHAGEAGTVVFAVAAIRARVFERFGPLDETLRDCEDVEYSTRLARRARIVITEAVAGHHDAGGTLRAALATQWRRSVPLARLAAARPGLRLERINRLPSLLAAAAAPAALAIAPWFWPAAPLAALAAALALAFDADLLRHLARHHGARSLAPFAAVHLCFLAVLAAGIAAGLAATSSSRLLSRTPPERSADHATH